MEETGLVAVLDEWASLFLPLLLVEMELFKMLIRFRLLLLLHRECLC